MEIDSTPSAMDLTWEMFTKRPEVYTLFTQIQYEFKFQVIF